MTSYVFDLNDIELRILRDGTTAAESTGFAFVQGANVEFGESARRRARRRLSTSILPPLPFQLRQEHSTRFCVSRGCSSFPTAPPPWVKCAAY